jgi:hypothetical protein
MKVLLIAADGKETDFPALKAFLDQIGIPFDTLIGTQQQLTWDMLSDGASHGYYQGIILTTGNLGYDAGGGNWQSVFDGNEWFALWDYEAKFGVRQLTSYTVPGGWPDTYGLNYVGVQDTTVTPLQVTLTAAGKTMYPYLNTASPITIKNAWTYLGTVISSAVTTPLLVTSKGYPIASITKYADGRQNLTVTTANNPYLIHSLLLSYGNINWVTKEAFLGERHVYLNPQNDDILIDDDIWNTATLTDTTGLTYRMTGADLTALVTWQDKSKSPTTPNGIITEWAFVGQGATVQYGGEGIYNPDTLTPAIVANQGQFRWVNHTYTHQNLDAPLTAAQTFSELTLNNAVAISLTLTNYRTDAFINPDISGLTNPLAQQGLAQFGIKYEISDTSQPGWNNPSPNAGFISSSGVLIIPRRPTNLFYNLDTNARWVSEYNCYYGPTGTCAGGAFRYWPTNLTYQQILGKESDVMLQYLLKWDIDPLMFHQPNTRNLGTAANPRSLQGDLINATLTKYRSMYSLPILNVSQSEIGKRMADRMAYNKSGVTGAISKSTSGQCTMTISTVSQAAIPVTGPVTGVPAGTTTESYGGQTISFVPLSAGQTVPLTLPASACQ